MDGPNRVGIELEDIAEAMSQLANIGSELLRPEDDRDPLWRSIPVAKEIMVTKGIASRAPWEAIQVFIDPFMYQIHYIFWSLGFGLRRPHILCLCFCVRFKTSFSDHRNKLNNNMKVSIIGNSVQLKQER